MRTEVRAEHVRVVGDRGQLVRVLRNLVDNAHRHARSRVLVTLGRDGDRAVLDIADDGPGVPAADRIRIFERFVRLDDARARADGGSGLGLAIVAEVVAAHDGQVWVEDAPGGGALFRVRLPAAELPIDDDLEPADLPGDLAEPQLPAAAPNGTTPAAGAANGHPPPRSRTNGTPSPTSAPSGRPSATPARNGIAAPALPNGARPPRPANGADRAASRMAPSTARRPRRPGVATASRRRPRPSPTAPQRLRPPPTARRWAHPSPTAPHRPHPPGTVPRLPPRRTGPSLPAPGQRRRSDRGCTEQCPRPATASTATRPPETGPAPSAHPAARDGRPVRRLGAAPTTTAHPSADRPPRRHHSAALTSPARPTKITGSVRRAATVGRICTKLMIKGGAAGQPGSAIRYPTPRRVSMLRTPNGTSILRRR